MAEGRAPRAAAKTAAKVARTASENGEVLDETADGANALREISGTSGNLGLGFMGLALSLWSGAYAYSKFRQALGKGPILPEPPK